MSAALSLPALSEERRRFLLFRFRSQAGHRREQAAVEQRGRVSKDGRPVPAFAAATAGLYRPYSGLRSCLEDQADRLNCSFPNAVAEEYIISSHRQYFLNCTQEHPLLLDPPENVLLPLIITPICLIPFLVTLVVLKSKDGETQA
ncbi:hypothetical protein JD844_002350 [Phrynosoma platyrhinos]|uniref:Receptor activity modifying protein 2 n=1 Tax=Phrynosoma platyrhinos TaxID=52577 RepID=A0ABQ7TBA2_PHRPL|nr:hypothetical protein JD844_002350 [Phrynosoma platyrhinos]